MDGWIRFLYTLYLDTDCKNSLIYSVYALYLNLVVKSLGIVLLGTNIFKSNGFLLKEHFFVVVVVVFF